MRTPRKNNKRVGTGGTHRSAPAPPSTLQHLPTHNFGSHRTHITMATTATTAASNNTATNEQEVDNSSRWTRRVIFVAVISCLLAVSVTCALLYSAHQAQQAQQQQQPLVSVVVVTYNRAAFLPRTLRGILSQGNPLSPFSVWCSCACAALCQPTNLTRSTAFPSLLPSLPPSTLPPTLPLLPRLQEPGGGDCRRQ